MLDPGSRLDAGRRIQAGLYAVERGQRGRLFCFAIRRSSVGVGLNRLHLAQAVQAVTIGIEQQVIREAMIKNTVAGPQHRLGLLSASTNAVGKRDPGSEVYFVMDLVLSLETQTIADREIGSGLPVVFCIESQVGYAGLLRGGSGGDGELTRLGGKVVIEIRVRVGAFKVGVRKVGVPVVAHPGAEADVMVLERKRCVVLDFELLLRIVHRAQRTAAPLKILKHVDRWSDQLGRLVVGVAYILETRIVDELRAVDLAIADLHPVLQFFGVVGLAG